MANVVTPEEEDIESLCRLLLTIGKQLDTPKTGEADKDYMSIYFMRLNTIVENKAVSSRLIFMILVRVDRRRPRQPEEADNINSATTAGCH